ncbi:L-threonylcarbamoyladenylate synthase [Candidatus Peregrinibacteria bacterium]|nr:L-threonylcarbamoyladenylate synthase [Candidatus Peregrinibacteria bacterium]
MKFIPFIPEKFPEIIEKLNAGEVFVFPSDTSFGFSADPFSLEAIRHIQRIKKRDEKKPFLLLVADMEMAEKYGEFSEEMRKFAIERWEKTEIPTTILVHKKPVLHEFFREFPEIGIRVPCDFRIREFLSLWGKPLISTSANISGEAPLFSEKEIQNKFHDHKIFFTSFGNLSPKPQSEIWKSENTKLVRVR